MKIFVRNRSKYYGNRSLLFPYQAVLWFKSTGETRPELFSKVARFHGHLLRTLGWSSGALGKVAPQLVDASHLSIGILFNHRKYADEAKKIYKEPP